MPACEFYCQRISVDESAGNLLRIDARDESELMQEVTDIGLDIDEGMVLKVNGVIYYGSDSIHVLAKLSARQGVVDHLGYWIFKSPTLAQFHYPVLAACRNLLLKLLGKSRINNLD